MGITLSTLNIPYNGYGKGQCRILSMSRMNQNSPMFVSAQAPQKHLGPQCPTFTPFKDSFKGIPLRIPLKGSYKDSFKLLGFL